jgi:hypothetical protein
MVFLKIDVRWCRKVKKSSQYGVTFQAAILTVSLWGKKVFRSKSKGMVVLMVPSEREPLALV